MPEVRVGNGVLTTTSIDTELTSEWLPVYDGDSPYATLKANIPPDASGNRSIALAYRNCARIDCGVDLDLPAGFRADFLPEIGLAARGMVLLSGGHTSGRVSVLLSNVGKEILAIRHGDPIVGVCPTRVHSFSWVEGKPTR